MGQKPIPFGHKDFSFSFRTYLDKITAANKLHESLSLFSTSKRVFSLEFSALKRVKYSVLLGSSWFCCPGWVPPGNHECTPLKWRLILLLLFGSATLGRPGLAHVLGVLPKDWCLIVQFSGHIRLLGITEYTDNWGFLDSSMNFFCCSVKNVWCSQSIRMTKAWSA